MRFCFIEQPGRFQAGVFTGLARYKFKYENLFDGGHGSHRDDDDPAAHASHPWDADGRKVWEHRKMTLKAGSNLTRIESTIDSDTPGEIIVGIGLCKRDGQGGKLFEDKSLGVMSYWQPPEKDGTIGVGVKVDPATIVAFDEDKLNYLVLVKATAGKPFVYYPGACWDKGLDFHTAEEWERYLKEFKRQ